MPSPSPELVALARRILAQEAGSLPGSTASAAASAVAMEMAGDRLRVHLRDLLGSGGAAALFGRALHLAKREQPLLGPVALNGESGACFTGLAESLAGSTDEEASAAAATILTQVIGLLVHLLGDDLGMKPIRKLWPRVTSAREVAE